MYTEDEKNLIVLSGIEEVNSRVKNILLTERSGADAEEKRNFLIKNLPHGVYNIVKTEFYDEAFRLNLFENLQKRGIECVTYFSPLYPEQLKHIDEPPAVLFCKGNIKLLKSNCFSVVGSRRTPSSSAALCRKISGELTQAFTVVTGMAEGADSAAVEGALPSGKIISVLANGFDCFYPACNKSLIEKVSSSGLLISEYLPHILPLKYNFPYRNRIIAGLSRGTLVVSAGKKSGALITADYALEYGREVFAFPYGAGISSGAGCNALIKNGAYLTENILDIFEVFGLDLKTSEKAVELTDLETAVLGQIKITGEAFLPVIAQNLKMFTYQLIPVVSSLEIKGLIVRLGGNRYGIV